MRFPFDPLAPYIEAHYRRSPYVSHIGIHGKAVQVLGWSRRSAHRRTRFGVTRACADRAAVQLGMHPASIWPEWFAS